MSYKWFLAIACALALWSCKPNLNTTAEESTFGIDKKISAASLLKQIASNSGKVQVCFDTKGTISKEMLAEVSANTISAIKEWQGALKGYADWPYNELTIEVIKPYLQLSTGRVECPGTNFGAIKIHLHEYVIASELTLKGLFCTQFPKGAECSPLRRAWALLTTRDIFLGAGEERSHSRQTILHEIGHIFGLADVYYELDVQENIPQLFNDEDNSVMKCTSQQLTNDDINGIRWVWDYIKGRNNLKHADCSSGYKEWQTGTYQKTGTLFCVRDTALFKVFACPKPQTKTCLENKEGKVCLQKCTSKGVKLHTTAPSNEDWFNTDGFLCTVTCINKQGGGACIPTCLKSNPLPE